MDLHFATEKVGSLKDAALRYLVIVAGILTALGLNQLVDSRAHARQGALARATIQAELARNEVALTRALEGQRRQNAQFSKAQDLLGKESFDVPNLNARARQMVKIDTINLDFGFSLAALQHSAWDTAVASQSLQYMPQDQAIELSKIYATIQEMSGAVRQIALGPNLLANGMEADAYLRGDSKDAMKFARAIREHLITGTSVAEQYTSLLGLLQTVTRPDGRGSAGKAASSPASSP